MLYLWTTENHDIGYGQGMNDVLGLFVYAFLHEAIQDSDPAYHSMMAFEEQSIDSSPVSDSMTLDQVTEYIFSLRHLYADVYCCFERAMSLGLRTMYQSTKALSDLKLEVVRDIRQTFNFNPKKA